MEPLSRPSKRDKYSIIIPAAGVGKRMKMYGPKSLVKLDNNHTILSRQIALIQKCFRHNEIIVVGGFQYDKLEKKTNGAKLVFNGNFETTNVLDSILTGIAAATSDKVLVIYGDLVFNEQCLNLPFYKESAIVVCDTMKEEEVGCIYHHNVLENVFYRLPNKWAQITFFTGRELQLLKNLNHVPNANMWFGFEAINYIINHGGVFNILKPENGYAVDIDTSSDLKQIAKI